jgi:alpha-galactosidase
MSLKPQRIEASIRTASGIRGFAAQYDGSPSVLGLGPVEVSVGEFGVTTSWSVSAVDQGGVGLDSVTLVAELTDTRGPVQLLRHGYQSWSPTDIATLGDDVDPSTMAGSEFLQALHHADQRTVTNHELRSEWVTVLVDGNAFTVEQPLLVGFDGGGLHDGTIRVRITQEGTIELRAEAFFGGATLLPGDVRQLKLARWADRVGTKAHARKDAAFLVGWCSWYQYFHEVTEADVRQNLALADSWPFDVFQVDDGYQRTIGDWRQTNSKFATSLDSLATAVRSAGYRPGLWMAPFLVAPDSDIAVRHPEWLVVQDAHSEPLKACLNPPWGGGQGGLMYGLDTTHPEVQDHLAALAADLVDAGFTYLKLDFTYSPSFEGRYADPARSPAERVRAGFEALRRGAGDDTFLLGCGVPLSHVAGVVDAVRIGQDVAPVWSLDPSDIPVEGYDGMFPAIRHALLSTLARSAFHRRLWLNDPDCLLLRTEDTRLTTTQIETWARVVGASGGMVLVSDDLGLLGDSERALLQETIAVGRESDSNARNGEVARCPDLLAEGGPSRLVSSGIEVTCDLETGQSTARSE